MSRPTPTDARSCAHATGKERLATTSNAKATSTGRLLEGAGLGHCGRRSRVRTTTTLLQRVAPAHRERVTSTDDHRGAALLGARSILFRKASGIASPRRAGTPRPNQLVRAHLRRAVAQLRCTATRGPWSCVRCRIHASIPLSASSLQRHGPPTQHYGVCFHVRLDSTRSRRSSRSGTAKAIPPHRLGGAFVVSPATRPDAPRGARARVPAPQAKRSWLSRRLTSWRALSLPYANEHAGQPMSTTPLLTRAGLLIFAVNVHGREFYRDTWVSRSTPARPPAFYGSVSRDVPVFHLNSARACSLLRAGPLWPHHRLQGREREALTPRRGRGAMSTRTHPQAWADALTSATLTAWPLLVGPAV